MFFRLVIISAVLSASAFAQIVSEIRIVTDPADSRVRPLQTISVQVRAYGNITDADGNGKRVRLRQGGPEVKLDADNSGWLSKPFRFQGNEDEEFYQSGGGIGGLIFGQAQSRFTLQDAVLYTAPDKTGSYTLTATLEGKTATATITVANDAKATIPNEKVSFPPEAGSGDSHRSLVEHYAPYIAQETWFQPISDYLHRFDSDGDWKGDNNWKQAEEGSSQAYVYYAVMETETHWFLVYNMFHPRDYSDKCVVGTCHENDNEGMILTVRKDGSRFGRLQTLESLAHNNVYSHSIDRSVKKGVHNIDGSIEIYENSHPVVFIEAGGHGVYGSTGSHSSFRLSDGQFKAGTNGVTYVYKGKAERPKHAADRNVGYELLPMYDHWWVRAHQGSGRRDKTFDEYYRYEPYGNRPKPPYNEIAGSFLGREKSSNKAKPFWGWHDNRSRKKRVVATGQWALDPAYSVSQNLKFPPPFSLNYIFNPYLGIGKPRASAITTASAAVIPPAPAPAPTTPSTPPTGTVGSSIVGTPSGGIDLSQLQTLTPRKARRYREDSPDGVFDVRVYVDQTADVFVRGDRVFYTHEGREPEDDGSEYSQPLPAAELAKFEMEQLDGREKIQLIERPTAANDFTARLRITDPRGSDDRYHARLTWVRAEQAAAQPPARETPRSRGGIIGRHMDAILGGEETQSLLEPTGSLLTSTENDPSAYNENATDGLLEFRGRVDGKILFKIQDDRLYAEAVAGRPAEVERFSFSQALPVAQVSSVDVKQFDGRGKVTLQQRPGADNDFTAIVSVDDTKGGDDRYHFQLT